jgi:tetratricopeptide (TPR) repeat protein
MSDDVESIKDQADLPGKIAELMAQEKYPEAKELLDRRLSDYPGDGETHLLLAKIYLKGGDGIRDKEKALSHAAIYLEIAGDRDAEALKSLSEDLGADAPEQGVLCLERLYALAKKDEEKKSGDPTHNRV